MTAREPDADPSLVLVAAFVSFLMVREGPRE